MTLMIAGFLYARRRELFGGFILGVILSTQVAAAGQGVGQRRIAITWLNAGDQLTHLGTFPTTSPWAPGTEDLVIPAHCRIRFLLGRLYLISPDTDEVFAVDPTTWSIDQAYAIGTGLQPVDLLLLDPRTALVACRASSNLLRLNLASGALEPAVDLALYADADGVPEVEALATFDGRLFVSMQRLESKSGFPALPPAVGVIDLATGLPIDAVPATPGVQPIVLEGTAPHGKMQVVPAASRLFVKATGAWMDSGGLELVDLVTLQSQGRVIREQEEAAAELGAFVMMDGDNGYYVDSTDLLLSSHLHKFSIGGGPPSPDHHTELNYLSPVLIHEPFDDLLFMPVPDGVHVFDAASAFRLTAAAVPFDIPEDMTSYVVGCGSLADANGDGQVNGLDVQSFVDCVVGSGLDCPCLDLDGSGRTDSEDARLFSAVLLHSP